MFARMLLRLRVRETLRALPIFGTIESFVAVGGIRVVAIGCALRALPIFGTIEALVAVGRIGPVGISCALRTDLRESTRGPAAEAVLRVDSAGGLR
jgi:hypothetical protein